jgi:hypothetical protein
LSKFRLNWRHAITKGIHTVFAIVLALLGLGLMVGGIITDRNGAIVIGLCVAAAGTQQWIAVKKQSKQGGKQSQDS